MRTSPGSLASEATRGSAVRLLGEVALRTLRLGTGFLLMVGLGAEGFGLWAALWGVAMLVAEGADLGLRAVACPAVVAGRAQVADLVRAKGRLLALTLPLPLIVIVGGLLLATDVESSWRDPVVPLAALTLAAMLVTAAELGGVLLRAQGRRVKEVAVLLLVAAGALVGVAYVVVLDRPGGDLARHPVLLDLAVIQAAAAALGVTLALWWLRGALHSWGRTPVGPLLAESLPLGLNGALALGTLRIEILMLLAWRGPLEAGLFAAALKTLELLNAAPGAWAAGALPALTREIPRGSSGARSRTVATVGLLALLAVGALTVVAPQLAVRIGYAGAVTPLRILALAVVPMFVNAVALHTLLAAGRGRALPALTASRLLCAAVLGALLIPGFGPAGAALGLAASEWVLLLLACRACGRAGVPVGVQALRMSPPSPDLVTRSAHAA